MQVVGDVYLYGPAYVIEPIYVCRPAIFSIFWRPAYRAYHSRYYWGYYPRHYHYWTPFRTIQYRKFIDGYVNTRHIYHRTHVRYSRRAVILHTRTRRNDYGIQYPGRSYDARVTRVKSANGTRVSKSVLRQPNGTTRKVAMVKRSDGSKRTIAARKRAEGTTRVITVNKMPDGSGTVKSTRRSANTTNTAVKRTVRSTKGSVKNNRS